jgi:multiple antibiotic resistance protein
MIVETTPVTQPLLGIAEAFMLFFITLGPPLKTPAAYFARTRHLDSGTRTRLAWKTFAIATIAVFIGGFLGAALRANWHISIGAMLLAGGIIFFLVSLRTVLEQYEASPLPATPDEAIATPTRPAPGAFETAVPMIVTPYGLAAVIILLAASHDANRTLWLSAMLLGVMVLHLLAMLFSGPILRSIGPLPFKLFGTVIGSLTVGLSIQMMIAAAIQLGFFSGVPALGQ